MYCLILLKTSNKSDLAFEKFLLKQHMHRLYMGHFNRLYNRQCWQFQGISSVLIKITKEFPKENFGEAGAGTN